MKKINEKKKIYILPIFLIMSIIAISSFIFAADDNFQVTISTNSENNIVLLIDATKNIKKVELYKKQSNEKYSIFYQKINVNGNKVTITLPTNRLSTTNETDIRVKVTYEDGTKMAKNVIAPRYVPPTPTPTPAPSPTATNTPSTSSTPTQLPSGPTSDPGTSPNPSTTPTGSPSDPTTAPNPTATPQPEVSKVTITTTKKTMMLDKNHYNFTFFDVTVEPSTAKVTYQSSNTKVATVSSSGKIIAKGYGTAKITATAENNGEKASVVCNLRVIVPMTDKTSDSGAFKNYRENGAAYRTYYIRYYNPTTKKVNTKVNGKKVSQHWSDDEVEAYVNNAEWLVKNYPDKYGESKKMTYYHFPVYCNKTKCTAVTKPQGELVTKGGKYIILFTTKNQCLYLLKKNSKGQWKLDTKVVASGGYYWDLSKKDGVFGKVITYANSAYGLALHPHDSGKPSTSKVDYTNAFHLGAVPGYPTSGGCTHIGNKISDPMAKRLKRVFVTEKNLIKVLYY